MSVIDVPWATRRASRLAPLWATLAVAVPAFGRWLYKAVRKARQLALYVGGFAAICYAAWQVAEPLGWLTIGAACLLFEWLTSPPAEEG